MALNRFNVLWHIFLFEEVPKLPPELEKIKKALPKEVREDEHNEDIQEDSSAHKDKFNNLILAGGQRHMKEDKDYALNYDVIGIESNYIDYLDT